MIDPKARLGYMYGLNVKEDPYDRPVPTGGEQFFYGREKKERRMAGDILNLELTQSPGTPKVFPLPSIGSAELRATDLSI